MRQCKRFVWVLCCGAFVLPSLGAPEALPAAADALARKVLQTGDHAQRPFAIVDKQAAVVMVFRPDGSLAGRSPALLGSAEGDGSLPGVGERTQSGRLLPEDRTTPAGRFDSMPGRNVSGEAVVWIDFDTAFAIHRVRPGAAEADRLRRLARDGARDKRVSAGCVVVPVAFYRAVVEPVLGREPGVVYVMPEHRPWPSMWDDVQRRGL